MKMERYLLLALALFVLLVVCTLFYRRSDSLKDFSASTMSTLLVQPAAETKIGSRIPTLDGWRGIAILLVLCEHAGQYGRFKNQMWTNLGSSGVDIFFVLSGFIITTRLIQERANHASIDLRAFYLRRAFRILPLVVIYLLALCLISRFADLADFHWQEVVGSLFFFRNYQFFKLIN